MNISFNPLAEQELNDAAQCYELESAGLGAALLTEVQRCCGAIVEHPEVGRASATVEHDTLATCSASGIKAGCA